MGRSRCVPVCCRNNTVALQSRMEVQTNLRAFLLSLVFFLICFLDFGNCSCKKQKLIKRKNFSNTTVTELSLWSKSGVKSAAACSTEYGRDKQCVSFFYNTQSGVCTAHTVQFYLTESSIAEEGSLYYTLQVDKRNCAEVLNNDPDCPDGMYIINPDDGKGPARVYCDMSPGGDEWTVIEDCAEILSKDPNSPNGVYFINPADGVGHFRVFCDMTTDGGRWTVFLRRQDGTQDFNNMWNDYKAGFGNLDSEFWLGNDAINRLTSAKPSELRINMEDWEDQSGYATYSTFRVGDEDDNYRLEVSGYQGNKGDSLGSHSGVMFSTPDMDNDNKQQGNCASRYACGWWYRRCHDALLTGRYNDTTFGRGVNWSTWHGDYYSLKMAEMKLRPI